MAKPYYNTTDLEESELQERIEKAETQEEKVEALFVEHPNKKFTPWDVRDIVFNGSTPITSVRRAITNLTDKSVLTKTDEQREGPYEQPCYTWQLSRQPTLF